MSSATTTSSTDRLAQPGIARPLAMQLAEAEYARCADVVAGLKPEDWTRPTDNNEWNVRELVSHINGMAKFPSSPLEMVRQLRAAKSCHVEGEPLVDAQNRAQVRGRAELTTDDLAAELRRVGPRGAKGRRRTPGFVRGRRLPDPQVVNDQPEDWSIGYLLDVILTRDAWMHRMDLAKATGGAPVLTAEHDGVIVADVVREWTGRHGKPYELTLTGPAGGSWSEGSGGDVIVMDAVEFCRVISGRPASGDVPESELLATQVPF